MQIYKAPIADIRFALESAGYSRVAAFEAFSDYDLDTLMGILDEAGKFCTKEMLALNRTGDQEGVKYDPVTLSVTMPKGFKELYTKFCEGEYASMVHPPEYGGHGAPFTLAFMLSELTTATNKSFSMCPGLTQGLVEALMHYGSDAQKAEYLPRLIRGAVTGTMCLTEPQCGTDLGILTTRATPVEGRAGVYSVTGTKIWITFGEHDLTDNIIHLVLARLPDAPEGIKGISTFLVPKLLADGTRNPVFCGGLEHKMGIHASPTCVINLEGAEGYLVGEPHQGMKVMFKMMNAARLTVGIEGIALSEISYQTALAFAKDRRQMRALDPAKQDLSAKADNILVHPDVRRMLLNVRASTEGMRALSAWIAVHIDVAHSHPDVKVREEAEELVALFTPVVKSYCTERGFWNVSEAMQACGGAGYTTDWSIEQYLRDMRIALIYEGTNHIQALDLIGRKLPSKGGRAMMAFSKRVTDFIRENRDDERMGSIVESVKEASKLLSDITMNTLMAKAARDPEEGGAVASSYLNLFALTAISYLLGQQAKLAHERGGRFGETKLKVIRFFFDKILPEIHSLAAVIRTGKASMMALAEDEI
ncbi:MAG: acyl-CoA dehydrogenase [Deltaproteobacteria bacterium]|nr:acyl-CoA dehydrogenase [Deltaproteobacteria bacterium]